MATDSFSKIVQESTRDASEIARRNEIFTREINQASKGGVSSISKEETKIFYAATQKAWEGTDPRKRNERIIEKLNADSLEDAWNKVFEKEEVQKALEKARKNQQPISTEADISNGADEEKEEKGSPEYIKGLILDLDTAGYLA